jgi:hypothetical protein
MALLVGAVEKLTSRNTLGLLCDKVVVLSGGGAYYARKRVQDRKFAIQVDGGERFL